MVELPPSDQRLAKVEEQLRGDLAAVKAENAALRADVDALKAKDAAAPTSSEGDDDEDDDDL